MAAAARGRGHLRVSHADREQAIDVLKVAFALGRLAKDEFEERVGLAFTSRTYAELAAVVADIPVVAEIPAGPPARPRQPARAPRRPSINQAVTGGACMIIAAHIGIVTALLIGSGTIVILVAVLIVVGAAAAIAAMIVAS
jgi:Domain of unknown function (DUF1707)